MAKEDMSQLGFREYGSITVAPPDRSKEEGGFIAGLSYVTALADAKAAQKSQK
jgi:hypothetical protein